MARRRSAVARRRPSRDCAPPPSTMRPLHARARLRFPTRKHTRHCCLFLIPQIMGQLNGLKRQLAEQDTGRLERERRKAQQHIAQLQGELTRMKAQQVGARLLL